ncbi:MAG: MFS transporter [Rhodocyclaceae bacterium]|nr:MFS transporter [Rhodocyclaceae bacterium]
MTGSDTNARAPRSATWLLLASLYCAQGLPSGLIAHSLPVLLRQSGVDLALIGLLKLLALPWLFKALWAPWVDRIGSPRWGHRRGWILPLQTTVILCLAALALLDQATLFGPAVMALLGVLLLVNLAAATQDIATDGLTVRLLPARWRGLGNSVQVGGYKIGMLVSGSGLLLCIDVLGWNRALGLIAGLLLVLTLPIRRFDEQRLAPRLADAPETARGARLLWHHYHGLITQAGMGQWLLVVIAFKLGDALGSPMIKPMLVDQGWSNAQLGQMTLISTLAGIAGAVLGGALYTRLGIRRSLMFFGFLQALGIAAMALLVGRGAEPALVYAVTLAEQLADGMSTVALFAGMMARCRPEHEGADYTLQASVQLLLAGVVGVFSGLLARSVGYEATFLVAGCLGLLALPIVYRTFSGR